MKKYIADILSLLIAVAVVIAFAIRNSMGNKFVNNSVDIFIVVYLIFCIISICVYFLNKHRMWLKKFALFNLIINALLICGIIALSLLVFFVCFAFGEPNSTTGQVLNDCANKSGAMLLSIILPIIFALQSMYIYKNGNEPKIN